MLDDFEIALDTAFHENSHNWQDQLSLAVLAGEWQHRKQDPLYEQACLFAINQSFYDCSAAPNKAGGPEYQPAYREQPLEAHAYRAGAKLSAAVMRMLDE